MTVIQVKVLPRSSRNMIVGNEEGVIKIKLTAPPFEGKANKALKEFLAKRLGLPKKNIEIISGTKSRLKSVRIEGLNIKEIDDLLK